MAVIISAMLWVCCIADAKGESNSTDFRDVYQAASSVFVRYGYKLDQEAAGSDDFRMKLWLIGPEARDVLPPLFEYLKGHPDQFYEWTVCLSGMRGETVPFLIACLSSSNESVQSCSIRILGLIGPEAEPAVEELIRLLNNHSDSELRGACIEALGQIRRPVDRIVSRFIPLLADIAVRRSIIDALGCIGSDAKDAVPHLIEVIDRGDVTTRIVALDAILKIDPSNRETMLVVTKALSDRASAGGLNPSACQYAARRLAELKHRRELAIYVPVILKSIRTGAIDDAALPGVVDFLQGQQTHLSEVAKLFEPIDETDAMKMSQRNLLRQTLLASAALGAQTNHEAALEFVRRIVASQYTNYETRAVAAKAMFRAGQTDAQSKAALERAIRDSAEEGRAPPENDLLAVQAAEFARAHLQNMAVCALARVAPDDPLAAERVVRCIEQGDELGVEEVELFDLISRHKEATISVLLDVIPRTSSDNVTLLQVYAKVAAKLNAVEELTTRLLQPDAEFWEMDEIDNRNAIVIPSMADVDPEHMEIILIRLMDHEDHLVRRRTVDALGILPDKTPNVMKMLRKALADPRAIVRTRAAEALGDAPETAENLSALEAAQRDDYLCVRAAASRASRRISSHLKGPINP